MVVKLDPSMQGWVTLQLTRDPAYSRGFLSARSVTGFLSDIYPAAADEVGKIYLIADDRVCICKIVCSIFYCFFTENK